MTRAGNNCSVENVFLQFLLFVFTEACGKILSFLAGNSLSTYRRKRLFSLDYFFYTKIVIKQ